MKKNKDKLCKILKITKITVKYIAISLRNKLLKPQKNKMILKESLNAFKDVKKIQDVIFIIKIFLF